MAAALRTSPPQIGGSIYRSFAGAHLPLVLLVSPRRYGSQPRLNLRVKEERRGVEKRQSLAFASNTNPSEESKEESKEISDEGPPLLTILAGAFVFFLFSWLGISLLRWVAALIFG